MKALLLAGGLGTRLRPLTENLPKPMTPILNKPWLEHLILQLKEQGISDFVMAVKYQSEKLPEPTLAAARHSAFILNTPTNQNCSELQVQSRMLKTCCRIDLSF